MKLFQHSFFILLIFTAFSCQQEEADIFPLSPAERVNLAIKDYTTLLTNAENGWVMDYFATSQSPGYTMLVKFNTSGSASFASKSDMTTNGNFEQDDCLFAIIADNGPVLTFNTYNKILHIFSNPENPDGYGLEGDYEFVLLKAVADTVWLQGKKNNAQILLRRLSVDTQWQAYTEALSDYDALLFSSAAPKLSMKIGKVNYTFEEGYTHVFSIKKAGVNLFTVPFIVHPKGIRFYSPQTIEGLEFLSFELNAEKTALVSVENPGHQISGPVDLSTYLIDDDKAEWEFVPEGLSADVKLYYDSIAPSCQQQYAATDVKMVITYNSIRGYFVLSLTCTTGAVKSEGILDLNYGTNGKDILVLAYKGTGNAIGMQYYDEVAGLKGLMTFFAADFTMTTASKLNPKFIKITKQANDQSWITIKRY